ncbi:hypothetical protein FOBRF1_007066 [Fusarium oxysporum]
MSSSRPHPPLSDKELSSSGSKLRELLPAPVLNFQGTSSDSSQGPSLQPRLHPRANLTKIACEPCRKRKAKCCGERPKCKACINKGLECHYQASSRDLPVLKRKYDEIQEKVNLYDRLYDLLVNLPEQDSHAILDRLREGPDAATTILQVDNDDLLLLLVSTSETRLCKGRAVENLSDWLRGALPSGGGRLSAVATPGSHNADLGDASASTPAGGAPLQLQYEQPSNERSVYKCLCELSELVHKSLYLLHSPRKSLTAQGLLGIYTEYLDWYNGVPEVLRLGHNFTPGVLFAHMYYHYAVLLLFGPLVKLRIIGSEVSPRIVCLQAANAIQGFLTSYSRLYTLKWAPSFVPYFALASSIMHFAAMAGTVQINKFDTAVRTDPHLSEAVKQGIARLAEMTPCHYIAEQALHLLRYLAKKWNINVNIETGTALDPEVYERLGRSFGGIVNCFSPTMVAQDSISDSVTDKDVGESTSCQLGKTVESLEDQLFLPSALQGRPMFSKDEALEEAGFAVL